MTTWIDGTSGVRAASELEFAIKGTGSPVGVVSAPVGVLYLRQDAAGNQLWVKETGTGTSGWASVPSSPTGRFLLIGA